MENVLYTTDIDNYKNEILGYIKRNESLLTTNDILDYFDHDEFDMVLFCLKSLKDSNKVVKDDKRYKINKI